MLIFIPNTPEQPNSTWRTTHGDMTDEEWDLIADLIPVYSGGGRMGRPAVHARRDIVNAIFYVAATRLPVARPTGVLPELEHGAPLSPDVVARRDLGKDLRPVADIGPRDGGS